MSRPWSVQDAKAQLSEVLRRARRGQPQLIGTRDSCVVVSAQEWQAAQGASLGAWLVDSAPQGPALKLPSRKSKRATPFGTQE